MKRTSSLMLSEPRRNATRAAASLLLTATLLAAAGCRGQARSAPPASIPATPSAASAASSVTPATEREAELVVEGMHCATCPLTVKTAARSVPGVVDARVSMEEGRAWVRFQPGGTAPAVIAEAITRAGYPARPITK